jgi:hypothetical protein
MPYPYSGRAEPVHGRPAEADLRFLDAAVKDREGADARWKRELRRLDAPFAVDVVPPEFDGVHADGVGEASDHDLGGELCLWRVAMRPGAPIGFGMLGAMPWLGLPGNPVSSMVTFELFARPLIKRLRGEQRIFRRAVPVTAAHEIRIAPGLTHFLRAVVEPTPAGYSARLTGAQGSGLLTSMARANALLIVPPTREIVGAGESLSALWLDDTAESSAALPL